MTIGEDRAAEVFKHLSTREVQHLSTTMATMSQVSHQQLGEVLNEFQDEAEQYEALSVNASDYLRSVLVKALGEERASSLLEDILESRETASGIETLNFMEPQAAADIIRDEHPQIIATILVHLKRAQAADILAQFDERQRNDVVLRIATFGGVQPTALQELTEVLNGLLDGQNLKRSKMGGIRTAAEIINLMKTQQEESVIEAMRIYDGELAQKLSTKCSCSKTWSTSTIAAFSASCRKWSPNLCSSPSKVPTKRCARNLCAICRSVQPIFCATISPRVGQFVYRWSKANRKRFC